MCITKGLQSLMGCILSTMHYRSLVAPICTPLPIWTQQLPMPLLAKECWELLCPSASSFYYLEALWWLPAVKTKIPNSIFFIPTSYQGKRPLHWWTKSKFSLKHLNQKLYANNFCFEKIILTGNSHILLLSGSYIWQHLHLLMERIMALQQVIDKKYIFVI